VHDDDGQDDDDENKLDKPTGTTEVRVECRVARVHRTTVRTSVRRGDLDCESWIIVIGSTEARLQLYLTITTASSKTSQHW
jgi:hypothetical protein